MNHSKISMQAVTDFIRATLKSGVAGSHEAKIIDANPTSPADTEWQWFEHAFHAPREIIFYAGIRKSSTEPLVGETVETVPYPISGFFVSLVRTLSDALQAAIIPARQTEAEPPADAMRLEFQVHIQQKITDIAIALPEATALRIAEGQDRLLSKPGRSSVLDGLMDVQLPITVCLGSKEVPLFDVLKFGNGSVIEFDHRLDEPVQIIVDRRVVALGDIVLIDGNYGVRISEICRPQIAL